MTKRPRPKTCHPSDACTPSSLERDHARALAGLAAAASEYVAALDGDHSGGAMRLGLLEACCAYHDARLALAVALRAELA